MGSQVLHLDVLQGLVQSIAETEQVLVDRFWLPWAFISSLLGYTAGLLLAYSDLL